jgi:hypothetical protein
MKTNFSVLLIISAAFLFILACQPAADTAGTGTGTSGTSSTYTPTTTDQSTADSFSSYIQSETTGAYSSSAKVFSTPPNFSLTLTDSSTGTCVINGTYSTSGSTTTMSITITYTNYHKSNGDILNGTMTVSYVVVSSTTSTFTMTIKGNMNVSGAHTAAYGIDGTMVTTVGSSTTITYNYKHTQNGNTWNYNKTNTTP